MTVASQIFVLPTAVLGIGQYGPFMSPVVGAAYTGYEFRITPGLGWPSAGGPVMELTIEVSHDGGVTWTQDAFCDIGPTGNWSNPASGSIRVAVGTVQGEAQSCSVTDLYRFSLNVLRAVGAPIFTVYGTNY